MFCRLVYDLLPSGEWWDTILADSDRWGARKFTIGPFTAPVWSKRAGPVVSDVAGSVVLVAGRGGDGFGGGGDRGGDGGGGDGGDERAN